MPDGEYTKNGNTVVLKDEGLWVKGEGTNLLSGAAKTLEKDCSYVVNHCGISVEKALIMASVNPARYFNSADDMEMYSGRKGKLMSFTWVNGRLSAKLI
jgi:N-acetylglucosamine-6-phosphate deacetylase